MRANQHKIITITCILLACLLAGCGRQQGAADDTASSEENTGGAFSDNALAKQLGITESRWQETVFIGSNGIDSIEIDADIILPDTNHMCVVTLEQDEMTGERKQALIGTLAQAGSIGVYDEKKPPKWKAESMIKLYEDRLYRLDQAGARGVAVRDMMEETEADLRAVRQAAESAEETAVPSKAYEEQAYWGLVDGNPWTFTFFEDTGFCFEVGDFKPFDTSNSDFIDFSIVGEGSWDSELEPEEALVTFCDISSKEAESQAITFLEKLGYEGYSLSRIAPLSWGAERPDGAIECWRDGWCVVLGRNVDGIVVEPEEYQFPPIDTDGVPVQKCKTEQAILWINSNGFMHCEMTNPLKVKNVDTQNTQMLDFTQIQQLMKKSLEKRAMERGDFLQGDTDTAGRFVVMSEMRLMYLLLPGDSEYVLLPVWRISSGADDWNVVENYQFLNAIDGSEIDFISDYYEFLSWEEYEKREGSE